MSGRIDFEGIALANPLHEVAGREVWVTWPPVGMDFNDLYAGRAK